MEASQDPDDKTIMDFYGNETTENSAFALIHNILGEEKRMETLYFSDATEKGFKEVVGHGEKITRSLEGTFQLNQTKSGALFYESAISIGENQRKRRTMSAHSWGTGVLPYVTSISMLEGGDYA